MKVVVDEPAAIVIEPDEVTKSTALLSAHDAPAVAADVPEPVEVAQFAVTGFEVLPVLVTVKVTLISEEHTSALQSPCSI